MSCSWFILSVTGYQLTRIILKATYTAAIGNPGIVDKRDGYSLSLKNLLPRTYETALTCWGCTWRKASACPLLQLGDDSTPPK